MPTSDPAKSADDESAASAPRFDDILGRLRTLVEKLEGGNLTLEESLKSFEEGMTLCQKAAGVLDRAEKKVEALVSAPGGGTRRETFADGPGPTVNGGGSTTGAANGGGGAGARATESDDDF